VRYEDLRADAGPGLAAIFRWLGLPDGNAHEIAEKLSFENVPKEKTGSGNFARKAQPGEWREALTPAEQALIVEICGRELEALGYETTLAQAS
jgi:hypothetical protein